MTFRKPDNILISMVAAAAANNVIGDGEKMPWHIPEDLKLFRKLTSGKPVIMGRKTYDSIGRPLPNRENIIITRDTNWNAQGVHIVHDLQAALDEGALAAAKMNVNEICVIGGGNIYQQFLSSADRIYLTRIDKNFIGSARFPEFSGEDWECSSREKLPTENLYDFEIFFEQHNRK